MFPGHYLSVILVLSHKFTSGKSSSFLGILGEHIWLYRFSRFPVIGKGTSRTKWVITQKLNNYWVIWTRTKITDKTLNVKDTDEASKTRKSNRNCTKRTCSANFKNYPDWIRHSPLNSTSIKYQVGKRENHLLCIIHELYLLSYVHAYLHDTWIKSPKTGMALCTNECTWGMDPLKQF